MFIDEIIEKYVKQIKHVETFVALQGTFKEMFAEVYKETAKRIKQELPEDDNPENYLYDDKHDDRIRDYWVKYEIDKVNRKASFAYAMERIAITEAYSIYNKMIFELVPCDKFQVHAEMEHCKREICSDGVFLREELKIPPYHTSCKCWIEPYGVIGGN